MSQIAGPAPQPPGPTPSLPAAARRPWLQRPVLVIPLALTTTAAVAAAVFLALRPVTITARGTVIDGHTGRPVAFARLHAGGKPATANARGVFRIPGLAPGAQVSVRARYYAAAQVTAAGRPLRVRLAPVPVHVTVTSDLTGKPLPALVAPPGGSPVPAHADGTATLYLTGPGQTLTVTSGGYRPAHAVVARNNTATAGLEPTRPTMTRQLWAWAGSGKYSAVFGWVLRPATGYSVFPGTRRNSGAGGDPQLAHITSGYIDSVRVSVAVFTASRGAHWNPPATPAIVTGATLQPVRLAGHRAWHAGPDPNRQFDTMWSSDPVCVITMGPNQASADAVMTAIIKAMTGAGQGS